MYTIPATLSDDIKYYDSLVDEFLEDKLEPVKFKAIRVPMGIYEQRKNGTFMVRIRCAGGFITPVQLKKVAEIAHRYKSDLLHVTTRQEIQIQNVDLHDTPLILQNLKEIGLSPKGGGGNTVRNILASVDSGITSDEVFDVTHYAFNLTTKLIAEPDSFTLPRKFKIAFSNSEKDNGYAAFNDLGFIAQIKNGKRGFKVYIGGSLGSKPMVGFILFDFAPEEDLFYITDAAKKLFSRYGNRKNKHKARLRYVFYKLGKEEVFRIFFEIYNEIKKLENIIYKHKTFEFVTPSVNLVPEVVLSQEFEKWKERYVVSHSQEGLWSVIVALTNGNINSIKLRQIAEFASQFGNDVIRFSMRQNIHFRNIPTRYLGNVYNFLAKIDVDLHVPLLLNTLIACTGADTCRLGICLSKGVIGGLRKALVKSDLPLDKLRDLSINVSGCPNSCGQQIAADLGFYGKVGRNNRMFPAYHIVAGASIGLNPKLAEHLGEISAFDLPKFTVELLGIYLTKEEKYKTFYEYIESEGKNDITNLLLKYKDIPDFCDDKNYYFDWGSDQIFSLAARGVPECSAGLFDMIDVDMNTINIIREKLENETEKSTINQLLYKLILSSSRMLLITRGAEPRNNKEVFDSFISNFIDVKLINNLYSEIIETARDNEDYDFSEKRETILELSKTVIDLYESMDDSLQFKFKEHISVHKDDEKLKQETIRYKDFRGVICPMNFVKTKIELSTLNTGDILEILLDDGEPIENVPGSILGEGHQILEQKKIDNFWSVTIRKG